VAVAGCGSGDRNGFATVAIPSTSPGTKSPAEAAFTRISARTIRYNAALNGHGPYIAVLVVMPDYGNVRMVGNLLGDPKQTVMIGAPVEAVFEHTTMPTHRTRWCSGGRSDQAPFGTNM